MSTDPRRLLDYGDDLNDVLRSALDAEKSAPMDPDAARLAKIGARIAERVGAPPPNGPPPGNAAPVATGLGAKAPFILLAAATIAGLVAIGSMNREAPAPVAKPVTPAAVEAAPTPIDPPASSPIGISANDLPSAPTKAAPKPAAAQKVEGAAPTQEEIALIGRAHDAVRSDPMRALTLCKEHETKFAGSGHFAQEREAVAIEALVNLNRREEATRRFDEFERKYPSSSHRVHLSSLLAR